ncbi:hypothetical protein EML15_04210 [Corynebacterium sp. sy017]|uniref:hypothetical protein n=1 Tax=unclassified Corynebacterium TaxID=2624378 RepID=UPI001184D972|nr:MULTISPECIES: hypothetical protein [unclassified Corynebacterium]MBP3088350.1 hypothetical protein [Corynebacterium sp. sy017]TSD91667.1 hypothetical protein ELY17_04210 [Corynebacterium sp. SY003]
MMKGFLDTRVSQLDFVVQFLDWKFAAMGKTPTEQDIYNELKSSKPDENGECLNSPENVAYILEKLGV